MDDRAVSTVQTVLAETRWLPVPCPTEYLPALARDVLYALEQAGFSVAQLQPQWTWSWPEELTGTGSPGYGFSVASREEAEAEADPYMTIVTRLVGPWAPAVATPQEQPTDADGDPICSQCSMPEPAEWCWHHSVSCPFGKPPRSQP